MPFEMLVGLDVVDDDMYARYRGAIAPILKRYGGGFRYDFRVSETLKSEVRHRINRVFTIFFADEAARDAFFADGEYKAVRAEFFVGSVNAMAVLAEYLTNK
jgi:uncharacterized protein (DUF1330 family)